MHRSSVRVLIVHASHLQRAALTCLIQHTAGLTVAGSTPDVHGARALLSEHLVDVTLLASQPLIGRLEDVIRELAGADGTARILLLAPSADEESVSRALEMGAQGILLDHQGPETLLKAIKRVHAGGTWADRRTMDRTLVNLRRRRGATPERADALTTREREIVSSIGRGLANKAVAELLHISSATVRNHLTSVYRKLGVSRRGELMLYAYRHRLADMPAGHGPHPPS